MRLLLAVLFSLFAVCAQAQTPMFLPLLQGPLNGSAPVTATGFDFTALPLLVSPTTATRQFAGPFTQTFRIKTTLPSLGNFATIFRNGVSTGDTGLATFYHNAEPGFPLNFLQEPSGGLFSGGCAARVCMRWTAINDGNWHDVVWSVASANGPYTLFVDGVQVDSFPSGTFTNQTGYFQLGASNNAFALSELRIYSVGLQQPQATRLHQYYAAGLIPSAPDALAANLLLYVPLGNCTGTPPARSCPDAADGSNPFTTDQTPPAVVVTAPAPGTVSGSITLTATCVDAEIPVIACTRVEFFIDNYSVGLGVLSGSNYNLTWNSAGIVDGSHSLTAKGTNIAGKIATSASVAVTTNNGISNHNWFFDSVAGNDANNCQSSGTACQTQAKMQSKTYYGGDTISLKAGSSWTMTHSVLFNGIGGNQGIQNISGAVAGTAGVCRLTVPSTFGFGVGSTVTVANVGGVTGCSVNTTVSAVVNATDFELAGTTFGGMWSGGGTVIQTNVFPSGATITLTTYGGGTCNNYPGGTTTGCATFLFDPASTQFTGVTLANLSSFSFSNVIVNGNGNANALLITTGGFPPIPAGIFLQNQSGTGNTVTVNNVQVMDVGTSIYGRVSGGTTNWTITNNRLGASDLLKTVDNGIFLTFPGVNGTITGNYVQNINGHVQTAPGYSNSCCGSGIVITNGGSNSGQTVLVQNNVVNTGGTFINSCGAGGGIWNFASDQTIIKNNEVYNYTTGNCDEFAFDFDGGVTNSIVQYNYAHDNLSEAMLMFNLTFGGDWKNNTVNYNVFERNGGGVAVGFSSTVNQNATIYNNTIYSVLDTFSTTVAACYNTNGATFTKYFNNLCWSTSNKTQLFYTQVVNPDMTISNNLYYAPSLSGSFATRWGGTVYTSLATFQAATGKDANSVAGTNPNLAGAPPFGTVYAGTGPAGAPNPNPTGYKLSATSAAAMGHGINPSTYGSTPPATDYFGNAVPNAGSCGGGSGYNMGADNGCH